MTPATPAEIAAIRRRYLLMATSVFALDLAFTLIFTSVAGVWCYRRAPLGIGVVLLGGVN